jgi:hypothetical protein
MDPEADLPAVVRRHQSAPDRHVSRIAELVIVP